MMVLFTDKSYMNVKFNHLRYVCRYYGEYFQNNIAYKKLSLKALAK